MFAVHPFPPVIDDKCTKLILGSFPSVKSREAQFYYGHPQNRSKAPDFLRRVSQKNFLRRLSVEIQVLNSIALHDSRNIIYHRIFDARVR